MSDFLWAHGLQLARPPCPSPTPGACSNSCSLSQWCHPTIILCCPLLLLPSIFPSFRVFSNESVLCIKWPKCWSFSFSWKKKQTKPFTLVNNLSGMGFCLRHEIEVTFFFCVDLNWPSIIYWQDHPFSSLLWCQHGKKSSDHMHMNYSRTLLFRWVVYHCNNSTPSHHFTLFFYVW